jgi:hypothetical protein
MGWTCRNSAKEETLLYENPKKIENFEDLNVNVRIKLRWMLQKQDGRVWSGFIWLRIGTGGGLL